MTEMSGFVVTDIDANHDVGREADEPGVLFIVGGPGLAGDRLAKSCEGGSRGAGLHHAFHHRGDLVGGHRVQYLLAAVDQLRLGVLPSSRGGGATPAFAGVVLLKWVTREIPDAGR